MNCESYCKLSVQEQEEFVKKVTKLIATDERSFQFAQSMINRSEKKGVFQHDVFPSLPPNESYSLMMGERCA